MIVYHGTSGQAQIHTGLCVTREVTAAINYAQDKNDGGTITAIEIDLGSLRRTADVEYDYDGCEPIIPDDFDADVAEFTDSDMGGNDHDTIILMTDAALAAARVVGTYTIEEAEEL